MDGVIAGPVHAKDPPLTLAVCKFNVVPEQIGALEVGAGVEGVVLITTAVVPARLEHPLTVTISEYVPALTAAALGIVGSSREEVKPLGPVQEYVAPG